MRRNGTGAHQITATSGVTESGLIGSGDSRHPRRPSGWTAGDHPRARCSRWASTAAPPDRENQPTASDNAWKAGASARVIARRALSTKPRTARAAFLKRRPRKARTRVLSVCVLYASARPTSTIASDTQRPCPLGLHVEPTHRLPGKCSTAIELNGFDDTHLQWVVSDHGQRYEFDTEVSEQRPLCRRNFVGPPITDLAANISLSGFLADASAGAGGSLPQSRACHPTFKQSFGTNANHSNLRQVRLDRRAGAVDRPGGGCGGLPRRSGRRELRVDAW
jgi:hypothetical protein